MAENLWDKRMALAEARLQEMFTKYGPALRGGEDPPFQRHLTPSEEQYQVWDVLSGKRAATPDEVQFAMSVVQHNLQVAQMKAQNGG